MFNSPEMRLQAVVRPRLDRDTNTFRFAQLRKSNHELVVSASGSTQAHLTASSTSSVVCPLKALWSPAMNLCRYVSGMDMNVPPIRLTQVS